MFFIGLSEIESTEVIVNATRHLPIGADLGRIRAVTSCGILSDAGIFDYDADEDLTSRVVQTPGGVCERTCWRNGSEIGRIVFGADAG